MKSLVLSLLLVSFSVLGANLEITNPNGGQVYLIGSTQKITINKFPAKSVKVELSNNGGLSWIVLSQINNSARSKTKGQLNWVVTGPDSNNCLIRVSAIYCKKSYTTLSNIFSIGNITKTIVIQGQDGKPGSNGTNGINGKDGVSPSTNDVMNLMINNPSFITEVVNLLKQDEDFLNKCKGVQGPKGDSCECKDKDSD